MKGKLEKISVGHYLYRGYDITYLGWYAPDKCYWWEAVDTVTGCADYHEHNLRDIIDRIDEEL